MKPYYEHAGITIYHGDCREILPQIAPLSQEPFDLICADPPYNLGKNYGQASSDNLSPEEYWQWFGVVFGQCLLRMRAGYLYVSHCDKGVYEAKPILEKLGFRYIQTLIWWGRNGYSMQLHRKSWSYRHEPILFMEYGDAEPLTAGETGDWYTSVIEGPRPQSNFAEGRYHPTQKPWKLYSTLLRRTPGRCMLDPTCGSGSTLIAAKAQGKTAIGIEIEEKYCEIAAKRLSQEVFNFSEAGEHME